VKIKSSTQINCLLISIFVILGCHNFLHANTIKPLEDAIAEKINYKRKNPSLDPGLREIFNNYDDISVVAQAKILIEDPNEAVKKFGYDLLKSAHFYYKKPEVNTQVVNVLVKSMGSKNRRRALDNSAWLLKHHKSSDFSEDAKAQLKQHFEETIKHPHGRHTGYTILLVGLVDMKTEMGRLQDVADSVNEPSKIVGSRIWKSHRNVFAALQALARMGDKNAIDRCIAIVDSETDEFLKVSVLLSSIAYIRQPEAVEYIKKYLYSYKWDPYAGPCVIGISYTERAAQYLEKMIVGFPTLAEVRKVYRKKYSTDPEFKRLWSRPKRNLYYRHHYWRWFKSQTSIEIIR